MTQDKISKRLVVDRLNWVDHMLSDIHSLPLSSVYRTWFKSRPELMDDKL